MFGEIHVLEFFFAPSYRILLVGGFVTMLVSSPSLPELLFPGMILLALGGAQLALANMQVGITIEKHGDRRPGGYFARFSNDNSDFAIFAFERNVSLVAICAVILVMQRLSSEATTCPDTMMRQVYQRAAIWFFLCSSNH